MVHETNHFLGIAFVVDDVHKGCNLAFRYPAPPVHSSMSPSVSFNINTLNNKKLNGGIISSTNNIETQLSSNNIHIFPLSHIFKFYQLTSAIFAKLFRPKNILCNDIFELEIDELHFISYPILVHNSNNNNNNNIMNKENKETAMFNVIFAFAEQVNDQEYNYDNFRKIVQQISNGLLHEEKRCGYVTKEVRNLLNIRDELLQNVQHIDKNHNTNRTPPGSNTTNNVFNIENINIINTINSIEHSQQQEDYPYELDPQTLIDVQLEKSNLANDLKNIYHALENKEITYILLNGWIQLSLIIHDSKIENKDIELITINKIRPYHTLLLFEDPIHVLKKLPSDSSTELVKVIKKLNPLRSFQELYLEIGGISLNQLFKIAAHLVRWKVGKIIDTITKHNMYQILSSLPNSHFTVDSVLALKFRRKFPPNELIEVLSGFTPGTRRLGEHLKQFSPPQQQQYMHILVWLLQKGYLVQLHRYVYLLERIHTMSIHSKDNENKQETSEMISSIKDNNVYKLFNELKCYFNGTYHLEEIMWRHKITRNELRTVITTFKDLIVCCVHE